PGHARPLQLDHAGHVRQVREAAARELEEPRVYDLGAATEVGGVGEREREQAPIRVDGRRVRPTPAADAARIGNGERGAAAESVSASSAGDVRAVTATSPAI